MSVQECLIEERQKCTFNVQKMTQFLYPKTLLNELKSSFQKHEPFQSDFNVFNNGRVQILKQAYKKLPAFLNREMDKQGSVIEMIYGAIQQMPGSIHLGMFIKCIQIMGSEQQKKKYLQASMRYQIIGCYAQTQIAHGSDIQSLQTIATFIEQTGQIELHTPSINAAKFWPGDLGVMANHALVFAQLIIKGKKHGVHPFIVQIRNQNWECLPGITAGDIGPKMAFYAKQNGFLLLDRVRIPKSNILARFLQITSTGELKRTGDPKIAYATMMFIRQYISTSYPKIYGQAITIAVRYGMFRKQFKNKSGQEMSIISYQAQQQKLITRISEYVAISVGGNVIRKICLENSQRIQKNQDVSLIDQTHACLCLGKALYSEMVYDGMQICRKACGGHGYSHYSGIPNLIGQYAANLTHEGQNTVLYLQVARYILKNYKKHMTQSGKMNQNAQYIASYDYFMENKCPDYLTTQPLSWRLQDLRKLLAQTVCCLVQKTTTKILNKPQDQSDVEFMGYFVGCNLQNLAKAHGVYFTFVHFMQDIICETNEQVKVVLTDICKLFGITWFLQLSSPVIENSLISKQHIASLHQYKEHLLSSLRPNMMGIVDSFYIPQSRLRTHLAKGNPYENYLQMARKCQINQKIPESAYIVKGIGKALAMHNQAAKL